MEYVYPAVFHPNEDGSYTIVYPDLPGCISEGKSLANALVMAQSALSQWVQYLLETSRDIPKSSPVKDIPIEGEEFVTPVRCESKDKRAVKRTVSIPKWMDERVATSGLSLSRVLQDALSQKFL
ncbi:MAG: type II toxin-antitoxin system HicB family antitoxin [Oscillospiraceae bacterium]|nr:type II toxin-antitoxin system HicB family antitoxin [Oscillospiraceae bacterium]